MNNISILITKLYSGIRLKLEKYKISFVTISFCSTRLDKYAMRIVFPSMWRIATIGIVVMGYQHRCSRIVVIYLVQGNGACANTVCGKHLNRRVAINAD